MKKQKGYILFLIVFSLAFSTSTSAQILQESFEGDATNYDANTFTDGASDYFAVFNTSSPPTGWPRAFTNVDGSFMFGAEDMDDVDNPLAPDFNGYIVISSQNVSAYDKVEVRVALGAVYDGGNDESFEENQPDGIFVQYAFDGNIATAGDANVNTGTYTTIGQFKGNDGINPTGLYEDTNLDGHGNGTLLTEAFQDFTYTFNTSGATNVSIRIIVENDLSEEIGIDNIRIYGIEPVPVELTLFTATVLAEHILLNWQTATEVNNYGFDVERRVEGEEWEKIAFVEGHGNSNSPKEYTFVDTDNLSSDVKYRLKQIDIDGGFEYSPEVEVKLKGITEFAVKQNFPNPFNPSTQIEFNMPSNSNVEVKVYNALGMEVETLLNEFRQAGMHSVEFNASNLSSGIYFYRVVSGNNSMIRKMVLLR